MSKVVITVIGKDKSGIIANVTAVLYEENANLEDLSMTNLEGEFVMVMMVDIKQASPVKKIQKHLNELVKKDNLIIGFNLLSRKLSPRKTSKQKVSGYVVTVVGDDQTGIVYRTSSVLAKHKLNITDLNTRVLSPTKKKKVYVLILEVDIPNTFKLSKLEDSWKLMKKEMKVDVQLKKVEAIEF